MDINEVQHGRDSWFGRRKRLGWRVTRRFRSLSPIDRVHIDDFPYPQYAYGVLVSCMQARMLGQPSVTVVEFGLAGGNGLVALEQAANEIGPSLNVEVDVLGFDSGEGMPASRDTRDMVYWYRPGAFKMDIERLRSRLTTARLFLGPVEERVSDALGTLRGPVGFCSFDLDYYTASVSALQIFDAPSSARLPRVLIYADDIFGWHDLNVMCSDVGEERAFADFNRDHDLVKIHPIRGLRFKRPVPALWNEKMFALHDFAHPEYDTPINPNRLQEASSLLRLQ